MLGQIQLLIFLLMAAAAAAAASTNTSSTLLIASLGIKPIQRLGELGTEPLHARADATMEKAMCTPDRMPCTSVGHSEICCPPTSRCQLASTTAFCCDSPDPAGTPCLDRNLTCSTDAYACGNALGGGCCPWGMRCLVDSCMEGFGPLAPAGLATATARVASDGLGVVETAAAGGAAKPTGAEKSAAGGCGVRGGLLGVVVAVGIGVGLGWVDRE